VGGDGTMVSWQGYIVVPDSDNGVVPSFNVSTTGGSAPINARAAFYSTYDDVGGVSANAGLIQEYRPVGCAVLATFTGPMLENGGNIASAFLPGGASRRQFFTNGSNVGVGNLAAWQNVAKLKESYNGPLSEGAYTWYAPTNPLDYSFRTPDDSIDYPHPDIVVSGQWAPGGAAPADGTTFLRIEVWTVYELQTDRTVLESKYQHGSTAVMDNVLNQLMAQRHSMPNATHMDFIKSVGNSIVNGAETVGKWLWKNRKGIAKVGTAVASAF